MPCYPSLITFMLNYSVIKRNKKNIDIITFKNASDGQDTSLSPRALKYTFPIARLRLETSDVFTKLVIT